VLALRQRDLLAQRHSRAAVDELLASVQKYIVRCAWRAWFAFGFRSLDVIQDLKQEGALGALIAVKRFNLRYDVTFLTFASPHIRDRIVKFCRRQNVQHSLDDTLRDSATTSCRY